MDKKSYDPWKAIKSENVIYPLCINLSRQRPPHCYKNYDSCVGCKEYINYEDYEIREKVKDILNDLK